MKTPGDPRNTYLARLEWLDDGTRRHPAAEPAAEPERLPARRRAAPARCARVFRDESKAWVDVVDEVRWIDEGTAVPVDQRARRLAARVPRAARRRRRDASSRASTPTSSTSSGVDEENGWLYFLASPDNATERYLYRVEARRVSGAPERVTPADQPGTHTYDDGSRTAGWRSTRGRASTCRRVMDVVGAARAHRRSAR